MINGGSGEVVLSGNGYINGDRIPRVMPIWLHNPMLVLEMKIYAKHKQCVAMDEAIRTGQFIRNKALRFWMENKGVGKYQLSAY